MLKNKYTWPVHELPGWGRGNYKIRDLRRKIKQEESRPKALFSSSSSSSVVWVGMITIGRKMEETTAESHSFQSESPAAVTPSPPQPSTVTRLWRPAAQRNLRNQWSNLASYRQKWVSLSSTARSHAISLVNACLSQRYFLFPIHILWVYVRIYM